MLRGTQAHQTLHSDISFNRVSVPGAIATGSKRCFGWKLIIFIFSRRLDDPVATAPGSDTSRSAIAHDRETHAARPRHFPKFAVCSPAHRNGSFVSAK